MAGKNKDKQSAPIDATQTSHTGPDGSPAPDGYVYRRTRNSTVPVLVKAPVRDTRSPEIIFADKVEDTREIMQRQFDKLVAIGNGRLASPSPRQEEVFRNWLAEESDRALDALFGKLHAEKRRGSLLTSQEVTPGFREKA